MATLSPDQSRQSLRSMLQSTTNNIDPTGLELLRLIHMTGNLYDVVADAALEIAEVSGPRWRLLLRLHAEEMQGNHDGVSPTHLSRCQHVSKNTISALVRGLEEQKLIERTLDPLDRRGFRIRLSQSGRKLLEDTIPRHLAYLNELASGLADDEQSRLIELLEKLFNSLVAHARPGVADHFCTNDASGEGLETGC